MLIDLFVLVSIAVLAFDFTLWAIKRTVPTYQPKHGRRRSA